MQSIQDEQNQTLYASYWDMDDAFCDRMRAAIGAGLESAPIGVVTTPGTFIPTKHCPLVPSPGAMDFDF
jgi:hypothetical protein